jgi:hypothetical protein
MSQLINRLSREDVSDEEIGELLKKDGLTDEERVALLKEVAARKIDDDYAALSLEELEAIYARQGRNLAKEATAAAERLGLKFRS